MPMWQRVKGHPGVYRRPVKRTPERPSGFAYRVWYRDAAGKGRSRDFSKQADADRFHASVKRTTGTPPDVESVKATLAEFAAHVMATSPHWKPKTRDLYETQWRVHVAPRLGSRR